MGATRLKAQNFDMPHILVLLIWAATALNLLSTFYGLELILGANTFRGDILCAVGGLLVITMALASDFILKQAGRFSKLFKLIWVVSLFLGLLCALKANLITFHAVSIEGEEPNDSYWRLITSQASTMKGILIIFVTVVCSFLSTLHSRLPESFGRYPFGFYRAKEKPNANIERPDARRDPPQSI